MGSILLGDLDDRLLSEPDADTETGRRELAAGRLSLLMLVMVTQSLGHTSEREGAPLDPGNEKTGSSAPQGEKPVTNPVHRVD